MKILLAKFQLEANEHVPMKCDMEDVAISYGKDALAHMQLGNVFDDSNIQLVPVICADATCSGVMKYQCFEYIEKRIGKNIENSYQICWATGGRMVPKEDMDKFLTTYLK